MRNCPKSVSSSSSSDRPLSRGWLSKDTVSDIDVETDEYPFIIDYLSSGAEFVEGSPGVKDGPKQCVSYWESTISAHVLCLMWYLRVICYMVIFQ